MTSKNDSELRQLIGEAIGEASMCWSETPKGIFDSTRASKIVDRVVLALNQERVGEVVLASGDMDGNMDMILDTIGARLDGKMGSLIFREQEGK